MDKLCNVFWNPWAEILGNNSSEFGTGCEQKDVLDKECFWNNNSSLYQSLVGHYQATSWGYRVITDRLSSL